MKRKKTFFTALLAAMLLTIGSTAAWADGSLSDNTSWSYDRETKTLTISGNGPLDGYDKVNLKEDERPYAAIKDECLHVVIEDGITSIGKRNFAFMNSLASVNIPASVTSIGEYAFYKTQENQVNVTIASGSQLASIGICSFMRMYATIDLSGCTGLTSIPSNALLSNTTVTLPNTITSVAGGGLQYCTHVYIAPKSGCTLAVNGTPVSLGDNGMYDVASQVNNDQDVALAWITPYDLSHAALTLTNAKEDNWYAYQNGDAIAVACSVAGASGTNLTENTDYTVSITDSQNKDVTGSVTAEGTYTFTITGTGTETSGYYGSTQTTFTVSGPIALTSEITAWLDGRTYYADGEVSIGSRTTVSGSVVLDLRAGSSLTVSGGIGVNAGNSLTIGGTGSLSVSANDYYAGIGGNLNNSAGNITINGGTITATAGFLAAAIGGGDFEQKYSQTPGTSAITINGGAVSVISATVGTHVRAIGNGMYDKQTYNIAINGGQVTAQGDGTGDHSGYIGGATLTLGWTDMDNDFILADGYSGVLSFVSGKTLQYDDGSTSTILTADNIGSMGGKRLTPYIARTYTVTFDSNGGSAVTPQTLPEGNTATEPYPVRTGYRFSGWQLDGSAYDFNTAINSNITLTAQWQEVSAISYIAADGSTVTGFTEYIPLESKYTTLNGGTWAVIDDVAFTDRISVKGSVALILADGKTLTAKGGIGVTSADNAALSIFCQSEGTGVLVANAGGNSNFACIGGEESTEKRANCGTIDIYGGCIRTSGNSSGAGIGGGSGGTGGTISIHGGQIDVGGGALCHAIGSTTSTPDASITLGWTHTTDYIRVYASDRGGSATYYGTVTLSGNFLIDGTSTKARWSSQSSNNINNHKLVPDTKLLMDWADVQEAIAAGQTITLTNDVSSESGDKSLTVPKNVAATIDLNGHTLTHQHASSTGMESAVIVNNGGTLTICDGSTAHSGTIIGNIVGIYNLSGTLTMTGGTIRSTKTGIYNAATATLSGVTVTGSTTGYAIIADRYTLSMTDCRVTGNTAGGVHVSYGSTLSLSGKMTITGNTLNEKPCNVYLGSDSRITLAGALDSDSRIGVSGGDKTITNGASGNAVPENFTSDDVLYNCIYWNTDSPKELAAMQKYQFIAAALPQTATNEYTISDASGWDAFCDMLAMKSDGYINGITIKLANNISVTRMAASSDKPFTGTFDGQGNTLTIRYNNTDNNACTAPFSYVDRATIQNLVVDGSISGTAYRAAGVIGETGVNTSHITNCVSRLSLSSGHYTGGFSIGGNVEIEGCVFDGTINASENSGGFVGNSNSALKITNCLFAPQSGSSISGGTFYNNGGGDITPTNSYYTTALGTAQGKAAHSVTAGANVSIDDIALSGDATQYTTSGITAYANGGIIYDGNIYYGSDDPLTLTLSNSLPDGCQYNYKFSGGTATEADNTYSLTMPDDDVTVSLGDIRYTIDAASTAPLSILSPFSADEVVYQRSFTKNLPSTVILPFAIDANKMPGSFYTLQEVAYNKETNIWEAKTSPSIANPSANTPYIFVPSQDIKSEVAFANVDVLATTGATTTVDDNNTSDWKLIGVYAQKIWTERTSNEYGFAATKAEGKDQAGNVIGEIQVGEFVRAGRNAKVKPTRAYLQYTGTDAALSKSAVELPERIVLVLPDATASVIDPEPAAPSTDDDDITTPTSEIAPKAMANVWSFDKTIFLAAAPNTPYTVIDIAGRPILTGTTATDRDEIHLPGSVDGIVIVRIANKSFKIKY